MIRALFLDFDGLICDTERAALRSWDDLYRRFGLVFPGEVWAAMTGHSTGQDIAAADLGRRLGRPLREEELEWRIQRKQQLADQELLRPGIAALIEAAIDRSLRLAVVSSSHASWVVGHLSRLGVLERFDHVVTRDQGMRGKPAPDLYLDALSRCGVTADSVIALEDSAPGVAAARAAGVRCVGVPNSVSDPDALAAADWVLDLETTNVFEVVA